MYTVYKHTTPSNKVYIGITSTTIEHRWGKNGINYSGNQHFYNAILKYGWDNIKHEILYTDLTKEEACEKEVELIAKYDATNPKFGYNKSRGGEHRAEGYVPSMETRKKMSKAHIGKTHSYRSISVTNLTTGEVFHSIYAAAKYYGISYDGIKNACEKFGGKYAGYKWKYEDFNYNLDKLYNKFCK